MRVRSQELIDYILQTNATIRETAKHFGMSKSNVHKKIKEKETNLYYEQKNELEFIFKNHFDNKHIKGGQSTKTLYKARKGL